MREHRFWLWARVMRLCSPAGLGQIRQIRDHFDVVTLTFTYTGIQLNRITDRAGRFVR